MNESDRRACFDAWLRAHGALLHRVANGFAVGADRADLMQEILLALWRAVPAFDGASKPSTFIYRVAHNAALTWRRDAAVQQRYVDRFAATAAGAAPTSARAEPRGKEALEQVYAHIRQLPPLERSLILLHLDGLGYGAIAEIHGLTENHVGVRLTRIRQKLADAMKEITDELR